LFAGGSHIFFALGIVANQELTTMMPMVPMIALIAMMVLHSTLNFVVLDDV
jgi:hypothetical protein